MDSPKFLADADVWPTLMALAGRARGPKLVATAYLGDGCGARLGLGAGDSLVNGREYEGIDAHWAAVDANGRLFVTNIPQYGSPYPEGTYVFDKNGKNVGYLTVTPAKFAVNSAGTYMYGIYNGVGAIRVSRILGLQ